MGRKSELKQTLRARIHTLKEVGTTQLRIPKIIGVSQGTISKTLKRIRTLGSLKSNNRCGRPRVTSPRTDIFIKKFATIHPTACSPEIRSALPSSISLPSITTINVDYAMKMASDVIDRPENLFSPNGIFKLG